MALGGRVGRKLAQAAGLGPVMLAAQGLEQVIGQIKGFVEALSPSTVQIFTQSMRDLQATVGQAFMPALQQMAVVVRSIADQISAPMQALAPIFADLARTLGDRLVFAFKIFATILDSLMPFLRDFLTITSELQVIFQAAGAAIGAAFTVVIIQLTAVFRTMRPVIDAIINAFATLVRVAIMVAAFWMRLTGNVQGLDALLKAFEDKKEGGRAIAQGPTSIKGLEQIGKDLALASATAMGKAPEDKQDDLNNFVRMIHEGIKEIKDGKSFQKFLKEDVVEPIVAAILSLGGAGANAAGAAIDEAASQVGIEDPVGKKLFKVAVSAPVAIWQQWGPK